MIARKELKTLIWMVLIFVGVFFLPLHSASFMTAVDAALDLSKWYAREHFIMCLIPAFFIAGVIAVYVSQGSVMKYFGANAKKWLSYTVSSISGILISVCSCTILPLFTSIYKRGAGLGPAVTFLYAGPSISILSIILTWQILGPQLGVARMIAAILFAIVIGLAMAFIFRKEEKAKQEEQMDFDIPSDSRPVGQTAFLLLTLIVILVFANFGSPTAEDTTSVWYLLFKYKWYITGAFGLMFAYALVRVLKIKVSWVVSGVVATALSVVLSNQLVENAKFVPLIPMIVAVTALSLMILFDKNDKENREWALSTWGFTKQIVPLLAIGVVTAGFLLGSTHDNTVIAGIIPNEWIEWAVGGNSLFSNFFASFAGAFMYFATLTEVPIVQGLLASGMGQGPALALLLAGPSLSLPSILVIHGVMGTKKTVAYVGLVIVLSTLSGLVYGMFF